MYCSVIYTSRPGLQSDTFQVKDSATVIEGNNRNQNYADFMNIQWLTICQQEIVSPTNRHGTEERYSASLCKLNGTAWQHLVGDTAALARSWQQPWSYSRLLQLLVLLPYYDSRPAS